MGIDYGELFDDLFSSHVWEATIPKMFLVYLGMMNPDDAYSMTRDEIESAILSFAFQHGYGPLNRKARNRLLRTIR